MDFIYEESKIISLRSYNTAINKYPQEYADIIYSIASNQDSDNKIIGSFDLLLLSRISTAKEILLHDLDIYQSNKMESQKPIKHKIKISNCYFDNLNIVVPSDLEFTIQESNNIRPESKLSFDVYQNSTTFIEKCELNIIEFTHASRNGGDVYIKETEISTAKLHESKLSNLEFQSSICRSINGSSSVSVHLSIINCCEIDRLNLDSADIATIKITSSDVAWGHLPSNGTLKELEIKKSKVGTKNGGLRLISRNDLNKIGALTLLDVDNFGSFLIRGWEIRSANIQGVILYHAIDFTGSVFLSEPNVGELHLAHKKYYKNNNRLACDEIEAGIRPLAKSLEQYGNFNAAYRLKRIEAQIYGIKPLKELGLFSWVSNHIYKLFSDYGISINRPPCIFLAAAALFIAIGTLSLGLFDGWIYTGQLSDFLSVTKWLTESFLKSTPIGITFEVNEPHWLEHAPNTQAIVRYLSIVFGSASYILFFLFFLAVRRRYQL